MNLLFFYDFETSGVPDFGKPSDAPHQPHIVQAAASLVDASTRRTIASVDLIALPTDWTIPAEVTAIHGVTTDHAMAVGVPEVAIVGMLYSMWTRASVRIAHSEGFDARIMRIACKRFGFDAEQFKAGEAKCTARLSAPLVREGMRAAGLTPPKSPNPKLGDAYRHFTGQELIGAHSARADVDACIAVYWACVDHEARHTATQA